MNKEINAHRVITMLNREELEFLDKLGKDALFSTGHKLSYNEILRTLIDFSMELGLSGSQAVSGEALKDKLWQQVLARLQQEKQNAH